MQVMTTLQYARYYQNITGLYISPESVAHLCRKGELDAFKEPERKAWLIRVKNVVYSAEEYKELEKQNSELAATIKNIAKLASQ